MSRTNRQCVNTEWTPARKYIDIAHDGKPWFKPDSKFKTEAKRIRRARARQAFREGRDAPRERHENEWRYT